MNKEFFCKNTKCKSRTKCLRFMSIPPFRGEVLYVSNSEEGMCGYFKPIPTDNSTKLKESNVKIKDYNIRFGV